MVMAAAGVVAVLPRPGPPAARIDVRGATGGPRRALDVSGTAAPQTGAPVSTEVSTTVDQTTSTSTPGATSTSAPTRGPATTAGPPTTPPSATSTTVAQVAPAGPATGRLAVTLVSPGSNGGPQRRAIATMAADGSDERVLATGNYNDPHWTPDGRFVLFESTDVYATWAVPAAGGPVTRLSDAATGVISPDGTAVINVMAVLYANGPPALAVQRIAETASGLVTVGPATPLGVSGVSPVWSPDGRRIVYATQMGGSSDLAIINADGSGRHDLLGSAPIKAIGMDRPGFTADGSTISFLGTDSTVYFIGADGKGLRPALPGAIAGVASGGAFSTAWSADRQRLAVLTNGAYSVVVIDSAGHVVATTHLSVLAFPVGIALDGSGQYVYYLGSPTNPPQLAYLYSAAVRGGPSQRVGTDNSASFPLSVLPG
jgi:hypothetical protein